MFKCEKCSKSGLRPNKIVTERKMVDHQTDGRGPRGGRGSQIVREVSVCDDCKGNVAEAPLERAEPVAMTSKEIAPGVMLNGVALSEEHSAR